MSQRSGHINPLVKKILHKKKLPFNLNRWVDEIKKGNVTILAQAITLIESRMQSDRMLALRLLSRCTIKSNTSVRVGVTGPPGVGKSSFIENLGQVLINNTTSKLAVLTIDPTSPLQGGSILGDKTRMQTLAALPKVYIRPSPAGHDDAGGIHLRTREIIQLLEYAGYRYIIVETVGVGQSEYSVKDITDITLLLIAPGGGDELQGIKRGITEIADMIIVTKDDSGMEAAAKTIQAQYQNALKLISNQHHLGSKSNKKVFRCSNISGAGIDTIVETLKTYNTAEQRSGRWSKKRQQQKKTALRTMIRHAWMQEWYLHQSSKDLLSIEAKANLHDQSLDTLAKSYLSALKRKLSQKS